MKVLLTILFLNQTFGIAAQSTISGSVKDLDNEAIPGANIFLLNTYDGATSDVVGNFEFTTEETGTHTLVVTCIGFKEFRQGIVIKKNEDVAVAIVLKEEINQLETVTITAGSFTAGENSRRTIFSAVDIATTAGATADIASALNTLPGTQKVGESGRLFVRGGDRSETKTFIDGMLVMDAYGPSAPNTPSRGRFLPFMFKGTSFSTGGYSAEYGQALSSALVLDSKDEESSTRTDIGLMTVGADATHSHSWDGGSAAGKIQYTNLRPYTGLINQEIDWKTAPASIEGVGAFRQRVNKHGMVKVYGNFSKSDYSLYQYDIDNASNKHLYALDNNYRYVNSTYKNALTKNWSVSGGLSYSHQQNDVTLVGKKQTAKEEGVHAKAILHGSLSDRIELKTGVELLQRNYKEEDVTGNHSSLVTFNEQLSATFIEGDIVISEKFVTRAGVRIENSNLSHGVNADPRLSLAYKAGKRGQLSLAYGTFNQTPINAMLLVKPTLKPEKAAHYILNYQVVNDKKTFRIETFYKAYNRLIKFANGNDQQLTNKGYGYAKGIELFWRDNESLRNTDYWISYSFLDTKRNYLDFPGSATPSFASQHNFSAVYKYFVQPLRSQVGFTYSYTSGRPYNNPNSEKFNGGKTPAYTDLSMNVAFLAKPYIIVYLSCSNLLGRDNIFGYEYRQVPNEAGMYNSRAIGQPAPRFLFLGIFITLSKDKNVNQLPSL